jgi:hypothetical protein
VNVAVGIKAIDMFLADSSSLPRIGNGIFSTKKNKMSN